VDLELDSSHVILRESAQKMLRDRYDYRTFQAISTSETGWSADIWAEFAELGWLGLPFAEDDGGIGGGAVEVAILMEEFGRALAVEPYLSTVVMGGGLVAALGNAEQRGSILGPLIDGKLHLALGWDERAAVTATPRGRDYVLSGDIKNVLAAPMANTLLVAARVPDGLGVFTMPANARGLTIRPFRTVDGGRAADISLADVSVSAAARLGDGADATPALAHTIQRAIAAASADTVGAMSAMVTATVDYTKQRIQFGQPIAKFQVIQHRLVEMKIKEEEARASTLLATLSLDGDAASRARAVSGAKAKVGKNGHVVAQEAVQLHGAIGTTNELSMGAYSKRIMAYEARFGSTREHLRRYAALIADRTLAGAGLLLEPAG
jgi:alkylation response protein AidB-like acyl-CoA dehydrogenase